MKRRYTGRIVRVTTTRQYLDLDVEAEDIVEATARLYGRVVGELVDRDSGDLMWYEESPQSDPEIMFDLFEVRATED